MATVMALVYSRLIWSTVFGTAVGYGIGCFEFHTIRDGTPYEDFATDVLYGSLFGFVIGILWEMTGRMCTMENSEWPSRNVIIGRLSWLAIFIASVVMLAFDTTRSIGAIALTMMWAATCYHINKYVIWKDRH